MVRWLPAGRDDVPPSIVELAARREGWVPESWRNRLLHLAERCQDLHPDRAEGLRQGAELMTCATELSDET